MAQWLSYSLWLAAFLGPWGRRGARRRAPRTTGSRDEKRRLSAILLRTRRDCE
ncbi:hypothetical protein I79_001158 [Cricetulus griseus]|uniref:Uncharacterized protein n=1 Tax=Cricetulus griseus TaxID=10029 RepID=G3GU11_CRIGR|nr:hypothetical protein I79_001158 [Cricetulus griseus]